MQKDYPVAKTSFEKSLRANPTDSATILGMALTYYETERYSEAAAQYARLLDLYPELALQYDFLGGKPSPATAAEGAGQ
jgi:tetratricopeptide (TPR) repeat protein